MQKERDRDYEVGDKKLQAFEPVALAVLHGEIRHEDREDDSDHFEHVEDEVHVLVEKEADEDEDGGDEHRDLRGGAHADLQGEIHAVLESDGDGREVLGRVADDGDHDDADEEFRPSPRLDKGLDGAHENLAHEGDDTGRYDKDDEAFAHAPVRTILLRDLLHVEMLVRVEREINARDIREDHADGNDDAQVLDDKRIDARRRLEEYRRDDERDDRENERDACRKDTRLAEGLLLALPAADEYRHAADEEEVRNDRTGERGLDDADEPGVQGKKRDDELRGVAEGGVQEAA